MPTDIISQDIPEGHTNGHTEGYATGSTEYIQKNIPKVTDIQNDIPKGHTKGYTKKIGTSYAVRHSELTL